MFAQWAVEVLKRLTSTVQPKIRLTYPVRLVADLLFAIAVFFCLNRRPVSNYNSAFWSQFLYFVQLFKVVYTLRFLLVELIFRELRTFFCFVSPVVSKLAIVRKWQTADPCVLKVVNLAFFLVFMILNLFIAYSIEWVVQSFWGWLRDVRVCGRRKFFLSNSMSISCCSKRRKQNKSPRYRIRAQRPKSTPPTQPFGRFWPKAEYRIRCVHPSCGTETSPKCTPLPVPEALPRGYRAFSMRTTRSGKNY